MATIVFADDGIVFNGATPDTRPLGGAESGLIKAAEELARRGHAVTVVNRCEAPLDHKGVKWRPIGQGFPEHADLYIANRGDKLITAMPQARRTAFWIHNPASYLLKWRYLWKLWRVRPAIIFIGAYHATTYPAWAPGGERVVIPYGLPQEFLSAEPVRGPGAPRAVFTSNPLRGLDWLLDLWERGIAPAVPGAELHVFSGAATYGAVGDAKAVAMQRILDKARGLADKGVILRDPVAKGALIEELRAARVMLYKGTLDETYCMAVGEAQAMGLPAVVTPVGSMPERVVDGKTGVVAKDDRAFVEAAVAILSDDATWTAMHEQALATQRSWTWDKAAERFEALIPRT